MLRKVTLFLLAFVSTLVTVQAQYCGFDKQHQHLLNTDPVYAQKIQQMDNQLAALLQSSNNSLVVSTTNGLVYEIPVVIHVIHTGGPLGSIYNPTDAQLTSMIDYLNKTYEATWAAYPSASTGGTFIPLRFALAKRTPNCTPTNGINHVDGSSVAGYTTDGIMHNGATGADEATIKALSIWPNTQYYNVWIVNKIDGQDGTSGTFVAGYAYFPGAGANVDGTIMLATQAIAGEITLPHEIGHAFSLYHTFEGDGTGATCPTNSNCSTQGDRVCDTDPQVRSVFNCPTGTNACTGNPYGTIVHNFMDYSNCQDRFTAGQKTRVLSGLLTSRPTLISSLGATALPASPVTTACIPTVVNVNNTLNAGPRSVKISDATVTYLNVATSGGYTADGNLVYIDNTCKHQAELIAGTTYTFAVRIGTVESAFVYIDYNNDGVFQANEQVKSWSNTGFGSATNTFSYTIPTTTTIPGLVSCVPLRMRVISDRTASGPLNICGPLGYGQAEDYSIVIHGGGATVGAATVALTSGTNPSCVGAPLTFNGYAPSGATTPAMKWYVNSVYTGVMDTVFNSSALNDLDTVKIKVYYSGLCGADSAWSTGYIVHRATSLPPAVSIALINGNNPGCANQMLGFKATPTLGGAAPSYQWQVNGTIVGSTADTFSSYLANNDLVNAIMTSNSSCASPTTATSNNITITHVQMTAGITMNQVNGSNPSCAFRTNGFELQTTNAGANPAYQWFLNGVAVTGATNTSYTNSSLVSNDSIFVVLNATDPCVANPSDTSSAIVMIINPNDTPQISVAITAGANPGCLDSLIEFTATVTHHGVNPNGEWFVNGVLSGFTNVFSSNTLHYGDTLQYVSMATDGGCYIADTVLATPNILLLYSTPNPPLISFIGTLLYSNIQNNVVWFGPSGMISGANGQTYIPTAPGQYFACINNHGCLSKASNVLTISIMDIASYDLSKVKIYPNPSTGIFTLDWGTKNTTASLDVYNINGQGLMHEKVLNQTSKTIDISHFTNGLYFILVKDDEGKAGTIKVLLEK